MLLGKCEYGKDNYNLNIVKNRINSLETSIENNGSLPLAVRNILNNPRLKGIHDIVGNIIDVEPTYLTAITTSLGAAFNNIIVDNASSAEEAIKYLKENKFGRVTFLPINVMKPKYVDEKILNILKHQEGFINIASNLVRTESLYQTIISNQLGNTLIVDNIKNANIISKQINFQYKIVSLSGEIVHVGGAITGGETSKIRSAKTDKQELLEQTKFITRHLPERLTK